ncbi:hypothetical protein ScPMuIL_012238 [Solemya velum]
MEEVLRKLVKDASTPKFSNIREVTQSVIDILGDGDLVSRTPAYILREKCLEPLQLALESRVKKFATHAILGIQIVLSDERFHTSLEAEQEDRWLPMQILSTVGCLPNLPEDTQVEIMKLLVTMTFSTSWCMNARVIGRISEVYINTYCSSSHNMRGVVKAALTQLLGSFTDKLPSVMDTVDGDDVLADFRNKGSGDADRMVENVIHVLKFLTDRLAQLQSSGISRQAVPLLLEGIHAIITNSTKVICLHQAFQELLWKNLCPTLISLLGTPKAEKCANTEIPGLRRMGRGTGCSSSAPNLQASTAKVIYKVIIDCVGPLPKTKSGNEYLLTIMCASTRFPEAIPLRNIKAPNIVKALVKFFTLVGLPKAVQSDQGSNFMSGIFQQVMYQLQIKQMVDSLQESCHCNDSAVCTASVSCMDDMLGSLEQLSKGVGITAELVEEIHRYCDLVNAYELSKVSSDLDMRPCTPTHDHEGQRRMSKTLDQAETEKRLPEIIEAYETSSDENDDEPEKIQEEAVSIEADSSIAALANGDLELDQNGNDKCENDPESSHNKDLGGLLSDTVTANGNLVTCVDDLKFGGEKTVDINEQNMSMKVAFEAFEKESAQDFIQSLTKVLSYLMELTTVEEVDDALLQFASNFCSLLSSKQSNESLSSQSKFDYVPVSLLNADGVYITTISALHLNLQLANAGFYGSSSAPVLPQSENDFLEQVMGSGLLPLMSPVWLMEVYRHVTENNLLEGAGYVKGNKTALVTLLSDIDGLGSHKQDGQFLLDGVDIVDEYTVDSEPGNERIVEAGKKLSKRILSLCWDGVLDVLSVLLNGKNSCGITSSLALLLGIEGAKEESMRAKDAICMSLDGLQKAARLCCTLGLQKRCGSVFSQLANTSCVMMDSLHNPPIDKMKPSVLQTKPKLVRLHAAHVLSMDVVMTTGLEMGSHSADCWKHVFRCSTFISELEHTYFSAGKNQSSLPKIQQEQAMDCSDLDDMYGVPMMPAVPVAPRINVPDLIKQSSIESGWDRAITGGGVLTSSQASQALCGLSQEVERIFEDAASRLNLVALVTFLSELSESSRHQLHCISQMHNEEDIEHSRLPVNALHLYHLQEVLIKIVHSRRPLLHLLKAWNVTSAYLVEAAGHKDRSISKMAVTCIHDYIIAMLSSRPELPHFHINELLCKTFESLLCLEVCDGDVQDQIVCSICELVEACAAKIRSGWRPLFGALRAVKVEYTANEAINEARQHHIAAVLDVFDVYLNTDNILVFANATVDCILCLLKYVRGSGEFEDESDDDMDENDTDTDSAGDLSPTSAQHQNLCIPALQYLSQCCKILQSMWKMPECPVFHGAHRIQSDCSQKSVDPIVPHMNLLEFRKLILDGETSESDSEIEDEQETAEDEKEMTSNVVQISSERERQSSEEEKIVDGSLLSMDSGIGVSLGKRRELDMEELEQRADTLIEDDFITLEMLDNNSGILRIWFLMLEGLAGAVSACPKSYQPQTLEMLFQLLRQSSTVPGPEFALHCVNHLLLPLLQNWLRLGARQPGYWETGATNFKQCCGLCTDLIVDYIAGFTKNDDISKSVELMLKQLLDVMIECVAQPVEVISRLGCSCIRHVLLSAGSFFTEEMWQIGVNSLKRALDVTTYSLQQLMVLFRRSSDNFYGDRGQVKVAMRKDCTVMECERLKQLAQQVFLLDSQLSCSTPSFLEEDRSYVFLLYPPGHEDSLNPDHILARVPFRHIVVGLLSHQLLMQTVGSILLDQTSASTDSQLTKRPTEGSTSTSTSVMGLLPNLSVRNIIKLLDSLQTSYQVAIDFDSRPGLKFLIQKVAKTEVAVNLYKQAGASMVFYIHTLIRICSQFKSMSMDKTRDMFCKLDIMNLDKAILHWKAKGAEIRLKPNDCPEIFINLLHSNCTQLCHSYIDILLDREGITHIDQLARQPLFFLIAQADDLGDIVPLKANVDTTTDDAVIDNNSTEATKKDEGEAGAALPQDVPAMSKDQAKTSSPTSPVKQKSKKEQWEEQESKIYTLATDKLIKDLMTEYKKHKQQYSMPKFTRSSKGKKKKVQEVKVEAVDEFIIEQQKTSIMKDSEARLKSCTELLSTVLGCFQQLSDNEFRALLPTIFQSVNQLVCHAEDPQLKEAMGQWLHRVGVMHGFMKSDN